MENHGGALVARRQVHGGHRADALTVQDDILRADAIAGQGEEQREALKSLEYTESSSDTRTHTHFKDETLFTLPFSS